MKEKTTKECILNEALTLFSEKGYEAVSVAQIAEAVGIKAPSLYKHYKSKQDIFDAILKTMATRYEEQMQGMQMNGVNPNMDIALFSNIKEDVLIEMGKSIFLFTLHDEVGSKFRKMLMMERYRNQELASLLIKQYMEDPLIYQSTLFQGMIEQGLFKAVDAKMMALHFYSPMFLLLMMCDSNPSKEQEALQIVEQHIHCFSQLYGKE